MRAHRMAILAGEERTGKTLTAVLAAEETPANHVIVVTKAKALKGWEDTLNNYETAKNWTVTTYGKAHKVPVPSNFLLILDESHNYISGFPKPSGTFTKLRPMGYLASGVLHISATPNAQGYSLLFHQFALHRFGPWRKYKNFYAWFKDYGVPKSVMLQGRLTPKYDKTKTDKVLADVQKYFITRTRKSLGFIEPEDKLHYIELSEPTVQAYNYVVKHRVVEFLAGTLVCDSDSKLRAALHMLEGGVAKIDDDYVVLKNTEKVDYILEHFGDTEDMVIMYYFKAELLKLQAHFKKAVLLQATSFAEGVDLHKFKHLIIYSQDWSTARHSQRRARQANLNRTDEIIVHFLLVAKGQSEKCYTTVSKNKAEYVDSVFDFEEL